MPTDDAFVLTPEIIEQIRELTVAYMRPLNQDITAAYPETPDAALAIAIGFAAATLLYSTRDTDQQEIWAGAMNTLLHHTGFVLVRTADPQDQPVN